MQSSHAFVMDRGQVVMQGTSDQLRDDPQFMRYLTP